VHGTYAQMGAVTFSVQLLNLFLSKQFHSLKPAFCIWEWDTYTKCRILSSRLWKPIRL